MPLRRGKSREVESENIRMLMREGRPQKQAVAIAMKKSGRARAKKNPEGNLEWRKRQIVLPADLVARLFEVHGGQFTATYALASSGMRDLVSLSMIDACKAELEALQGSRSWQSASRADKLELDAAVNGLSEVRQFWRESSAKEAGMDLGDDDYEYDEADYGLSPEDEADVDTHSG